MVDPLLEERMQLAQETCSLVLSLRKKVNIKVRQPLQKVMIPVLNIQMKEQLEKMESLIMAEVNVKEIEYITATQGVISKKIKANFKTLGAKLGASMAPRRIAKALTGQVNNPVSAKAATPKIAYCAAVMLITSRPMTYAKS
jgi:isoleucyl-tRNA synthetase